MLLLQSFTTTKAAEQHSGAPPPLAAATSPGRWRPGSNVPPHHLRPEQQLHNGRPIGAVLYSLQQDMPGLHPSLTRQQASERRAAAEATINSSPGDLPMWLSRIWTATLDTRTAKQYNTYKASGPRRLLVSLQSTAPATPASDPSSTDSATSPTGAESSSSQQGQAGGAAEPNRKGPKQRLDPQSRAPSDRSADQAAQRPQQEPSDHNPSDVLASAPPEVQAAVKQLNPAASEVVPAVPSVNLADVAAASSP